MQTDEIIQEVRANREAYAARFNYNIDALFKDAKQQEGKSGHKIVELKPKKIDLEEAGG
jgi:hypothetical protein